MANTYISSPAFRWRMVGGSVDITFDMPGEPLWQGTWRGRKAALLCTTKEQTEIFGLGAQVCQLTIQIKPSAEQHTLDSQVAEMIGNPQNVYTLYQPGEAPRAVKIDPEVDISKRRSGGSIIWQLGIMESATVNTDTELATPNDGAISVLGEPLSFDLTDATEEPGMYAVWLNVPNPSTGDIIFLHPKAVAGYAEHVAQQNMLGTPNGTVVIRVPIDLEAGEYQLRLLLMNYNGAVAVINGPDVEIINE